MTINELERGLGLNHSISHLEDIRKDIGSWPIEKQAEYADNVTKEYCNDRFFIYQQFPNNLTIDDYVEDLKFGNSSAIGNIAYVALYTTREDIRIKLTEALKRYKDYLESIGGYENEVDDFADLQEIISQGIPENITEEEINAMDIRQKGLLVGRIVDSGDIPKYLSIIDNVALSILNEELNDFTKIKEKLPKTFTRLSELVGIASLRTEGLK